MSTEKREDVALPRYGRREAIAKAGAVAATIAGASFLAACTATDRRSGPARVTLMGQRNELSEDEQKQFEAEHANIRIEFIEADLTRLFAMYAAGNPPDLFRVQGPGVPQYASRRMLKSLEPYFKNSKLIKIDDLAPANSLYQWDGKRAGSGDHYGLVKDWSPDFTLFANVKAFEDAGAAVPSSTTPLTYDELRSIARRVNKKQGDQRIYWGFVHSNNDAWIDRTAMNMLAEKGQSLYASDFTKVNLTANPEAVKIFRYFFDLAAEGVNQSPIDPSPNWMGDDFTKNLVAILQYGYWFSAMAESDVNKGKVVMLPAPTWAGVRRDPTKTATGWVMSAQSKEPDAAWEVFEWYMAGKPAIDRAGSGWGVPALKSQYSLMPTATPFQQQVQKILQEEFKYADFALEFNPYLGEATFATSYRKHLEPALKGQITFDRMLQNLENEVNAAIADGRRIAGA